MKRRQVRGFTLIELLLVVALIAIASGLATFALRNPSGVKLEQEAGRLAALLESARAQSRASGIPVRWIPRSATPDSEGFRFEGLTRDGDPMPGNWLNPGVSAEIVGVPAVQLGPEPLIGPQRIVLRLDDQRLVLTTDGLGPFTVTDGDVRTAP